MIQDHPEVVTPLFDLFLIDGDSMMYNFILKCLELKKEEIIAMDESDLLNFLRVEMPV